MTDWLSVLRTLDEQSARGDPTMPRDFDLSAARARFDRLAELLRKAFGHPLDAGAGLMSDTSCFGVIEIPAELTKTRTKRTRIPVALPVMVSNFGDLAAYGPYYSHCRWIHTDDRERIEPALAELEYLVVPRDVLAMPYDGTSMWSGDDDPGPSMTWYDRFFGWL